MSESETILFRASITPKRGRLLVKVVTPLLPKPLYRSYPPEIGEVAAIERAVGHAVALFTALAPAQPVRVTWQAVLGVQ
ncbi:hypothetical protein HNQ38_002029 [Desulfovibrio intestinalis]|uniref:Uncharacterized protein n=1 Tax=Desulfovibrio intestinalis TaxID=58621 RepID=A0A7W8FEL8_9BACT|nr:hypothetical protein [Desulfovibrio intestinalis]